MPYIKKSDRAKYWQVLYEIDKLPEIETKGDLEFLIFTLMKKYMKTKEYRYSTLHDTVYASMHCADEFRRRYLDERENFALKENGDV